MANRIFDLKETKGTFEVCGIVHGVESQRFYTEKKTKTNKDFRAVNFGCEYDTKKSVYMSLNGMPQQNVYFSKRDPVTGKVETKQVAWMNRHKFDENGYRMIGVNLGLAKTIGTDGKEVNDKKTMHAFDACEYIRAKLKDDSSVYIRGNLEFSSFMDSNGNVRRDVKRVPNQISLCKAVDFDAYDGVEKKPTHNFTQTIVYTGIEKETDESGKDTGRFILSAKIVTYSDIVDYQFIIVDSKLANSFKKNLKPYNAIEVSGKIEVSHMIAEVTDNDDCWGEKNAMDSSVGAPTKTELVITGAKPSTIEREMYSEKSVAEAIKKINAAKNAEQNFTGKSNTKADEAPWGVASDDEEEEEDWG